MPVVYSKLIHVHVRDIISIVGNFRGLLIRVRLLLISICQSP